MMYLFNWSSFVYVSLISLVSAEISVAQYNDGILYPLTSDSILAPRLLEPYRPLLRSAGLIPQYIDKQPVAPKFSILEVKNFPSNKTGKSLSGLGAVSGLSTLTSNRVALFHRAHVIWQAGTFDGPIYPMKARRTGLIREDSIVIINGSDGTIIKSFGADRFYMPHGISSDTKGNLWVTDAALHQVFRYPADKLNMSLPSGNIDYEPDIVLGEAFIPGSDSKHFCKPTDVAISSTGLVFISDGYCNSRIMVFSPRGEYLDQFGLNEQMYTPHSLALIENLDIVCVADRDNEKILCFSAGLKNNLSAGKLLVNIAYTLGRVFAIEHLQKDNEDLLLVVSISSQTGKPEAATLSLTNNRIVQIWSSNEMKFPHDISLSHDKQSIYVADTSKVAPKKVFKFNIW